MDAITTAALSFQNPILTVVSNFLDDSFIYAVLILVIVLVAENRNAKRKKIMLALCLAFALAAAVKLVLAVERPCTGADGCPSDYSFPSTHATIAFALMVGFLNKKSFSLFLLFALFISFTRLNMGVHTFYDVAGALPVALVSYYACDLFWKKSGLHGHQGKEVQNGP